MAVKVDSKVIRLKRCKPAAAGSVSKIRKDSSAEGSGEEKMIGYLFRKRRKRVLIDINTQKDFFRQGSDLCVRNPAGILSHIRRMVAWARHEGIPVISICEVSNGNGNSRAAYDCLKVSEGRKKTKYTLLGNHIVFPADDSTHFPPDILRRHRQIILHNRGSDPFDEPRIERMLGEMQVSEFVLIGAGAEGVVEATALGLLHRGKKVTVVVDAVGCQNKGKAKLALRKIKAKGAKLVATKKLAGVSHLKPVKNHSRQVCPEKGGEKPLEIGAGH
jgi:nicotinamidase-related amidase